RQFTILYPNDALIRTAIRGCATYQLNWFDAHLWAYADHYGLEEILTEDFQHQRYYGTVRAMNPFLPSTFETEPRPSGSGPPPQDDIRCQIASPPEPWLSRPLLRDSWAERKSRVLPAAGRSRWRPRR